MKPLSFSGTTTLEELQRTVRETENMEFLRLVHMEKSDAGNLGVFTEVDPAADAPPDIEFMERPPDVSAEISNRLVQGQHLVFNEVLSVQGQDTPVLAFR